MNRHMQQIDHQTGEVVEGFVAYVVPKRKNGFQKGWMAMAQEAMMMLAQSNLTGNDMKVMWAMLARLDYENLIQVNQAEVSEQVGMNRHNVNRSICRHAPTYHQTAKQGYTELALCLVNPKPLK